MARLRCGEALAGLRPLCAPLRFAFAIYARQVVFIFPVTLTLYRINAIQAYVSFRLPPLEAYSRQGV